VVVAWVDAPHYACICHGYLSRICAVMIVRIATAVWIHEVGLMGRLAIGWMFSVVHTSLFAPISRWRPTATVGVAIAVIRTAISVTLSTDLLSIRSRVASLTRSVVIELCVPNQRMDVDLFSRLPGFQQVAKPRLIMRGAIASVPQMATTPSPRTPRRCSAG